MMLVLKWCAQSQDPIFKHKKINKLLTEKQTKKKKERDQEVTYYRNEGIFPQERCTGVEKAKVARNQHKTHLSLSYYNCHLIKGLIH